MADYERSTLKHSEHLLLDQPLLRLPHELLRKNFRSAHFIIEKDTSTLKTLLKASATAAVSGRASQQDVLRSMNAMINRMRGVKRKLTTYAEEEARLHHQMAARITHLDDLYSMRSVDDVKYEAWSRRRLDRLLADYLLRHGFNQSAAELAEEKGMGDLVDIETFVNMSRIRDALLNGSVTEALAWCTDNKKELRKMESKLEFMLRLQQYIELIRTQSEPKLLEAIAHARKYLIPYWKTYSKEVSQACGLLAFPPEGHSLFAYSDFYNLSRWSELADLFTTAHNNLLALPSVPLLHVALSSGLSALKTPACHSLASHQGEVTSTLGHGVCPICSTELNELAKNVPYAHHTKSHVEHDLMLLPNGRVYGSQRLQDQAKKAGLPPTSVKDIQTGEVYSVERLKKVYIT
ncbi:negative regulation of gluconeogenesis [Metarhizium rileyi]|uniref:GID complex subunit containing RING finger motif n=1 Tax=Metarhizium rileyi (strain RCEF 4871) TaxID=1649241 RepID=A0A162J2L7_METRR|nr:negative regulation of gluconeogenesis [Metarhizium rileyi RCEF 4871]TWU73531.1 GID complex subunit containing RING finger motif [Metarhizium rileyi]